MNQDMICEVEGVILTEGYAPDGKTRLADVVIKGSPDNVIPNELGWWEISFRMRMVLPLANSNYPPGRKFRFEMQEA